MTVPDALAADAAAAQRDLRHMRNLHDWRVKDLDAAHLEIDAREFRLEAAVARADRLEQALAEILADETYIYANVRAIARAALAPAHATDGAPNEARDG